MISCHLRSSSNSRHVQQIYTGLFLLHQQGLIRLSQSLLSERINDPSRPEHLRDARHAHVSLILEGSIRVHYDLHDSWEVEDEYLEQSDYYFKRSYSPRLLENSGVNHNKIHPLGLFYEVHPD